MPIPSFLRANPLCFGGLLAVSSLVGASCSSDGSGVSAGEVGPGASTYFAFQRESGIASVKRGDRAFVEGFEVINLCEGGMALDFLGNLYQADPVLSGGVAGGAIRIMNQAARRSSRSELGAGQASLNPVFDRSIQGPGTTLMEPRSVALAHAAGRLIVADTGDSQIKIFGASAGGDVAPLFTVTMIAPPWDVAYHEASDALYVTLTDGTISIVDDLLSTEPFLATRSIIPSFDGLSQGSVDLRGVDFATSSVGLRLVVSDLGLVSAGADGAIYIFDDVSSAAGLTVPDQRLRGATAQLRDPIDLDVGPGGVLRVADAGADRFVVFAPQGSGGSFVYSSEPSLSVSTENPLAVLTEPLAPVRDFVPASDLDEPTAPVLEVVAALAPVGGPSAVVRFPADLSEPPSTSFDPGPAPGGLGLDVMGHVYTSFTGTGGAGPEGGVRVLAQAAVARGIAPSNAFDGRVDRLIEIPGSPFFTVLKPVSPTALEVDEEAGIVVLSDPGRPGIWRFGLASGTDDYPAVAGFTESTLVEGGFAAGAAEPGQADFDSPTDRLYVAVSNGVVYAYDRFSTVPGDLPDRTITPTNALGGSQLSENLQGLVYDGQRDLLIVSDVGTTSGVSHDGAVYVFSGASLASGLTAPVSAIAGVSTGLDDPVSLAWDGSTLWVADRASGTISRFDDLLALDGDVAPSASQAAPGVVAIGLRAQGLGPASGGSTGVR